MNYVVTIISVCAAAIIAVAAAKEPSNRTNGRT